MVLQACQSAKMYTYRRLHKLYCQSIHIYTTSITQQRCLHITRQAHKHGCTLQVSSRDPLVDDLINIRVNDLTAGHHVTIMSRLSDADKRLYSLAHYEADESGEVNLETSKSLGGLYTGIEPMGLFWSMKQEPDQKAGLRLVKLDVTTPFVTSVSVYDGHVDDLDELIEQTPLASTIINRWYLAKNVERVEVRDDGLKGTFFIPKEGGPYPAVLDLFGGIGGTVEHRSALLASRGFASLALEYLDIKKFAFKNDLSYFETAVDWLLRQPCVIKDGAGVIGISKGAEIAMLTAYACKKVKAVVFINGAHHIFIKEMTYKGVTFPCPDVSWEYYPFKNGSMWMRKGVEDIDKAEKERCAIPLEGIDAHVLFITSEGDECTPIESSTHLINRMAANGKAHLCEHVVYPGAGHLLEPPHTPNCASSYSPGPGVSVLWGGDTVLHARAQEESWTRMRTFLKTHLCKREQQ